MSEIRRVVTGHDAQGQSVFASDEVVSGFEIPSIPGTEILNLWGSDETPRYPDGGAKANYRDFFAPVGGYRFLMFSVPPDAPVTDESSDEPGDEPSDELGNGNVLAEMERLMPGALETFDPDVPGMHRSATVDLLYVAQGSCELELDNGEKVHLSAGDTLVQSGTMHAWRNSGDSMCKIIAVIVGAELNLPT